MKNINKMTVSNVGDNNKNQIIRIVRDMGPISRADISRLLKMSKPSVSKNVKELLDNKIIEEVGAGNNEVGRKSTLLVFNSVKAYAIGVDIGNFKLRVGMGTLSGELIELEEVEITELSPQRDGIEIIKALEQIFERICEKQNTNIENILSVCIGIPGIRDCTTGNNILTPFIKNWEDFDIVKYYRNKYKFSITVVNNVNVAAMAEYEHCLSNGTNYNNVAYINFGIGIGAGLILNGKLFQGKNGAAGEIGFCCLSSIPTVNYDRNAGAFEKQVSVEYWLNKYNEQVDIDSRVNISRDGVTKLFDLYDDGDPIAKDLINLLFENIVMLLINITAILNLELIIFGGGIGERLSKYIPYMQKVVSNNVPFQPIIRCANLGTLSGVYGSMSSAISDILNDYKNLK